MVNSTEQMWEVAKGQNNFGGGGGGGGGSCLDFFRAFKFRGSFPSLLPDFAGLVAVSKWLPEIFSDFASFA